MLVSQKSHFVGYLSCFYFSYNISLSPLINYSILIPSSLKLLSFKHIIEYNSS